MLYILFLLLVQSLSAKRLVLMGGGMADGNADVWGEFVNWAGGSQARIGVVSAASATPEDSAAFYVQHFLDYGAGEAKWIPVHEGDRGANSDPDVVAQINAMTGFFFSGGDQARIISSLYNSGVESPALAAMRARYDSGAAMAGGTSAGTACMCTGPMIMGGNSYEALRYGAFEYPGGISGDLQYLREGGIGFLPDYITDSHFSERGREGRLVRLVADTQNFNNGVQKGMGVDENTALFIDNVGTGSATGEVIGANGVFFLTIGGASVGSVRGYWSISNVRGSWLSHGDVINLNSLAVTYASWKNVLNPRYDYAITSNRIFNGNRDNPNSRPEFVGVARSLYDSLYDTTTWGRTQENNPRFGVYFDQNASSGEGGYHPDHGNWQIAYNNLRIDMEAV